MKRTDFCSGWTYRIWGVPGDTPVTLPHDYSQHLPRTPDSKSGSAGGWFQGGNVIYDREIDADEAMLSGRVMLEFEGVLPGAEVYLEDRLVARQPYGSLSFHADLTPYLRRGKQKIRVNVHGDALPSCRWYQGTGICRPVYLLRGPKACIEPWGLRAETALYQGTWRVNVQAALSREAEGGRVRLRLESLAGACLAQAEAPVENQRAGAEIACPGAQPWSPEQPALYRLIAELWQDGQAVDREEIRVGFREVKLDGRQGLLLNGSPMKLRGGCVHQDHGLLGDVSFRDAEYRKARQMKDFGFNAVRCAHNPPAPAFLDACDELGLLALVEFTDVWNIGKNPYDYHLYFQEHWRQDLAALIRRDRRHPAVIMWSVGNEIPERDGSGDGYAQCAQMCALVRELDGTRLITSALNNVGRRRLDMLAANLQTDDPDSLDYFGLLTEAFLAPLDVAGYNYLARRYEQDLNACPGRFFCGTESVAREAKLCWDSALAHPRVIGDFSWAAMDYLGEAGIGHVWYQPEDGQGYFERWPWRQANCGDMDVFGQINPAGYYRQAVWGTLNRPVLMAQHPRRFRQDGQVSYWAWPERYAAWDYPGFENQPVRVEVYSDARQVTLLLNGETVAARDCVDCIAAFELPYQPGELKAVDNQGRSASLVTPGKAARVEAECDIVGEHAWLTLRLTDAQGNRCYFDDRRIRVIAQGCGLLACGNGDPASPEGFQAGSAPAWRGTAYAVAEIRPGGKIIAQAEGLPPAIIAF